MTRDSTASLTEASPSEDPDRASILIVDDLPEKLLVFGSVLEELGQRLVFAPSGTQALREVLKQEFAVILLDVNMPDMDGLETATLIRRYRRSAHTPIIFITAYADEIQTARGYSLGAVDYILSPVVPEILCSKIKVFVELFLMQRRIRQQADERVALAAAEAARRVAEENTRRSSYLASASRQLGDGLDMDMAVRKLLDLAVPELADLGLVCLSERAGKLSHEESQSAQVAWCGNAGEGHPTRMLALPPAQWPPAIWQACQTAMTTRLPVHLDEAALAPLAAVVGSALQLAPGEQGGLTVALVQPLSSGEGVLGVLMLAAAGPRDWRVLEELAGRAAIALENARLYAILQAEIVERRAAEAKLQATNQRKDEFLAMLSHELRNPLAPIRNAVEVIRHVAPPDAKLRWANEVMERQVRHLSRLVDELLDVARINQGKITLQLERVDVLAVIAHGVETVRPLIDHKQHQLTLDLPPGPVHVCADFARLSQVVANLLGNAAKYTEAGGSLNVSVVRQTEQVVITVQDNGTGIDPDLLPRIFEPFEQGHQSLDRSQGGLGVGLTLVQRLVQLHDGRVEAHSAGRNKGSAFRVELPCSPAMASALDAMPAPSAVVAPAQDREPEQAHAPHRVLIVDDNIDAAESVALVLQLEGNVVMTVADGVRAQSCLASFAPDTVILDIGLPGMDGYELARRLRRLPQGRQVLLIALTGYGQKEDRERAAEAGFDHHFVKPADPQALADCIARSRACTPSGAEITSQDNTSAFADRRIRVV